MYITCQQCRTMFRLDESLLKPTGSKVRCSQCGNVFVEYPPTLEADKPADEAVFADEPVLDDEPLFDDEPILDDEPALDDIAAIEAALDAPSEAAFDQELEGIDLDELDAIFDQGELDTAAEEKDAQVQTVAPENDTVDELDTQDLEMDFNLDLDAPDTGQEDKSEEIATALDADEFDTLDLDLDFDLDAEGEGEDLPIAGLTEGGDDLSDDLDLDLENLDFSLDEITETEEADADTAVGEDDLDLMLDMDEGADDLLGKVDDDLDLSELDELLGEGEKAGDEATEVALEAQEPEPVAEDDELLFDMDEPSDAALADAGNEEEDFDLAELDDMLGSDDDSGRISSGVDREVIDESAELALDDDTSGDETIVEPMSELEAATVEEPSEELDLSDLDAMLDDVDGPTDKGVQADEGAEELALELDTELEDKPVSQDQPEVAEVNDTQDEELDLSDIEQMLDGDDALDTQQLEADFLGLDGDKGEAPELELDDTDEIDLDEIEAAIDEADSETVADAAMMAGDEDQELSLDDTDTMDDATELDLSLDEPSSDGEADLELSLDDLSTDDDAELELDDDLVLELESEDADAGIPQIQEAEDELDLSDLDLEDDEESMDQADVGDAGDIELEFQVEEGEPEKDLLEEPAAAVQKQEESQDFSISQTVPTPQPDEFEFETAAADEPPTKKSTSKGLVALFIALLLGGAGYLYYAVAYQGLNIPIVSQLIKPEPKDPAGILKLTTMDINSKFVDTEKRGRIFVIEGKVRNGYSVERQMIRLQGKLFTTGKVLAKSEFSYAGVKIADEALSSLPAVDLKKKLNSGIAQGAATKVQPGGTLPFMIVFSELPENLDEFAIEVISSMQSK